MCKMVDSDLDLKSFSDDFEMWQKITVDMYNENKELKFQLTSLQKQCQLFGQSEKSLKQNNADLRCSVEKLQTTVSRRCEVISENVQLKERLNLLHSDTNQLEIQHRQQMTEATENLQAIQEAHKKDIIQVHSSISQQMRREIESQQKLLQDKSDEITVLHKQLADTERDKHTEIVKIRLEVAIHQSVAIKEYDAKLLKLQRQNAKSQIQPSSLTNNDIFRRKLQAAKTESERELAALRKRVAELEKQATPQSKHRKLH